MHVRLRSHLHKADHRLRFHRVDAAGTYGKPSPQDKMVVVPIMVRTAAVVLTLSDLRISNSPAAASPPNLLFFGFGAIARSLKKHGVLIENSLPYSNLKYQQTITF